VANVRRHLWVSGRVQGVLFRGTCAREAQTLGVAGWVRNTQDGAVEVVAEGDEEVVAKFIDWCHKGPPSAWVTHVDVEEELPQGLQGFIVR